MNLNELSCRIRRKSCEDEEKKAERIISKLSKLGFSYKRCLKSAVSTGYQTEQLAAKWLISHVDDPQLDKDGQRNYSIFLCPDGDIVNAIQDFWVDTRKNLGWNASHNFMPHITMLPKFTVPDNQALTTQKVMMKVLNEFYDSLLPNDIPLNFHTTKDFIGYLVASSCKKILEEFSLKLIEELRKEGVLFPAELLAKRTGCYHLSLAYGYPFSWHDDLLRLVNFHMSDDIFKSDCKWELCLFSEDTRISDSDVEIYEMKMSSDFTNDLNYQVGDHIALLNSSPTGRHGWARGLNVNSGVVGDFCLAVAERVPLYHAWVLHRSLPFFNSAPNSPASLNGDSSVFSQSDGLNSLGRSNGCLVTSGGKPPDKCRSVYIVRHAERMDMCFGKEWLSKCFDHKGVYKRLNLCMPDCLPARPYNDFIYDSPLTQIGRLVSREVGRCLAAAGVSFTHCYSSPALRCIQTATEMLEGCGQPEMTIRTEGYLFEWLGWYNNRLPQFMSTKELSQSGFPIDLSYKSLSTLSESNLTETHEKYYERAGKITKKILEQHKKKGSCILIMAHAGSLDTCSRPLLGKGNAPSSTQEFANRSRHVPYCGMAVVEERPGLGPTLSKWHLVESPIPPTTLIQSHQLQIDWKFNP